MSTDEISRTFAIKSSPRWTDLTGFQRDLLLELYGIDGPKGLELKTAVEHTLGEEVNHPRLYNNLDQLVEKELVEKDEQIYDRRSNCYQITPSGIELIESRAQIFASTTSRGPGVSDEHC